MNCADIHDKLHDLADGELSRADSELARTHLASCDRCARAYAGISNLKKLVRSSARTEVPAQLARNISSDLRPAHAFPRRWYALAAAAILVFALGIYVGFVGPGGAHPAHAQVLKGCLETFNGIVFVERSSDDGRPQRDCIQADLHELEKETGVRLDRLPGISKAKYCGASAYECPVSGTRGIRLDFVAENEEDGPKRISIFVLPLDALPMRDALIAEVGRSHRCHCVAGEENTILCETTPGFLLNVISNLEERRFFDDFRPTLAAR